MIIYPYKSKPKLLLDQPPVVAWWQRAQMLIVPIVMLGAIAAVVALDWRPMLLGIVIGFGVYGLGAMKLAGFRRLARQSDYRLCPHCAYELHGLHADAKCPECGRQSTHDIAEGMWRAWAEQ